MRVFMFLYLCRGENLLLTSEGITGNHTFFFYTWIKLYVQFYRCIYSPANES